VKLLAPEGEEGFRGDEEEGSSSLSRGVDEPSPGDIKLDELLRSAALSPTEISSSSSSPSESLAPQSDPTGPSSSPLWRERSRVSVRWVEAGAWAEEDTGE
jgi:hypothetical protein